MADTFTPDQVATLLNGIVATYDIRTYSLEEVAEMTGAALNELKRDCRAGRIKHTWLGRQRRMTARQVAVFLEQNSHGGPDAETAKEEVDDLAAVRKASIKSGAARPASKRPAA